MNQPAQQDQESYPHLYNMQFGLGMQNSYSGDHTSYGFAPSLYPAFKNSLPREVQSASFQDEVEDNTNIEPERIFGDAHGERTVNMTGHASGGGADCNNQSLYQNNHQSHHWQAPPYDGEWFRR